MLNLITQLFRYMKTYRKFWMTPIIAALVIIGGLLLVAQSTAIGPFIYAIF